METTDSLEGKDTSRTPLLPLGQPAGPTRRSGLRRAFVGVTVLLALGAALALLAYAHMQPLGVGVFGASPAIATPSGWVRYQEPSGAFTVAIPVGWTASRDTGDTRIGNGAGSDTYTMTQVVLGGPPRGAQTITVGISFAPIHNAFERRWYCQNTGAPVSNTKIDGLPATYDPVFGWLFTTSGDSFQINYVYPGNTGNEALTSAPTPIPPGVYALGQREMKTIIASFRPTPATPLHCA